MRMISRALLVLLASFIATIAAGFVAALASTAFHVTWSDLATLFEFGSKSPSAIGNLLLTGIFLWIYLIFWIVFVPFIAAAIIAEIFGMRSLLLYLIGAVVIAFLSPVFAGQILPWFGGVPISRDLVVSTLAAGLAADLVYWLIAGRKAGSWKGV
jgi:hypothetical protein